MKLETLVAKYVQEGDGNKPDDLQNQIEISMEGICFDMGYITIKTERWCIDDVDEMIELLNDFKKKVDGTSKI